MTTDTKKVKLQFCSGCGCLLRSPVDEADCDNCGYDNSKDFVITGEFDEQDAKALCDIA